MPKDEPIITSTTIEACMADAVEARPIILEGGIPAVAVCFHNGDQSYPPMILTEGLDAFPVQFQRALAAANNQRGWTPPAEPEAPTQCWSCGVRIFGELIATGGCKTCGSEILEAELVEP